MRPKILVPFDFSVAAAEALAWAADLQTATGGPPIRMIHAISSRPRGAGDAIVAMLLPNEEEIRSLERAMIQEATSRGGDATAQVLIRSGDIGDIILDAASSADAGLIVMGSRGRTGVKRMLLGSVAEHVSRQAACPVVTVHQRPRPARGAIAGTEDRAKGAATPRRILVATDLSEYSRPAIEYGVQLARHIGATIHLVYVSRVPEVLMGDAAVLGDQFSDADTVEGRKELDRLVRDLSMNGVMITSQVLTGFAAHALVVEANSGDYDLVVMGTHGRGGLRRLTFGTVAAYVVRHAAIPVLTVRALKRDVLSSARAVSRAGST